MRQVQCVIQVVLGKPASSSYPNSFVACSFHAWSKHSMELFTLVWLKSWSVFPLSGAHTCVSFSRNGFVMTAWLPTYFSDALHLSLTEASQAALFPPIAAIAASALAGPAADLSISNGLPVGPVRKAAQVSSQTQLFQCSLIPSLHKLVGLITLSPPSCLNAMIWLVEARKSFTQFWVLRFFVAFPASLASGNKPLFWKD